MKKTFALEIGVVITKSYHIHADRDPSLPQEVIWIGVSH